MPHVIVKTYSGKSDQQKAAIAEEVTKAIMQATKCSEDAVSVSIEDVAAEEWADRVYKPDILDRPDRIYKKPGYNPL